MNKVKVFGEFPIVDRIIHVDWDVTKPKKLHEVRHIIRFYTGRESIGIVVHGDREGYWVRAKALLRLADRIAKGLVDRITLEKCEEEICRTLAEVRVKE